MNRPKIRGTAAETAVVNLLRATYWPAAERRALAGGQDKGDIAGVPNVCVEVKAAKTLAIPAWLRELAAETANAKAEVGILAVKPVGVGAPNAAMWWGIMETDLFDKLHAGAGLHELYRLATTIRRFSVPGALRCAAQGADGYPVAVDFAAFGSTCPAYTVMHLGNLLDVLSLAGYGNLIKAKEEIA